MRCARRGGGRRARTMKETSIVGKALSRSVMPYVVSICSRGLLAHMRDVASTTLSVTLPSGIVYVKSKRP